ncbi:MAG: Ppx/GppA family phosphatase [Actinomycetota bacterium]|nr:Ppx/GppA family phosphatase [Actinomycetota bacterium]
MPRGRVAVVDLGSNSFRLVVYTVGEGWWKRTDEVYEAVRIGAGLAATGELGRKPMARALQTLEVFDHFCRATGLPPAEVRAVATSAIRDARNRDAFLARAREQVGFAVRVLAMEEEARYGFLAALNSTTLRDGAVLDIGGGSVQIVQVRDRRAGGTGSWPLGAVRMTERFLADGEPPSRKRLRALRAHVASELASAPWLASAGRRIVGLGGTVRNLAVAAQLEAGLPSIGVQGFALEREALDALVERLAALPAAQRGEVPGIKPSRADLVLAGAVVVQTVLEVGGFDELEVTEAGLREGVFFEALLGTDPPLLDDVRRESVLNLAAQYGVDPAHTAHVAALALRMFDELAAAGVHPGDPTERELLWAACMLHDVGVAVDYDDHHKHSRYIILSAGLPGFAPAEVALVAQAARFHRKGLPELGTFARLARPGDGQRLDRLATLLRLAEDLERPRDQSVRAAHVAVHDGAVRLDLEAVGEVGVARWAAERETELFRRAFGRRLRVAPAGPPA